MKLYYKSDYKIRETFTTQAGTVIDPRNYTFQIVFKGGKETTFTCSYDKDTEEYVNCVYDSVNNAVMCLLHNHGLKKGILQRELLIEEPDGDFPDDVLDYMTLKCLDIELVDTCDGEDIYDIYDDQTIITQGELDPTILATVIHAATTQDTIADTAEFGYLDATFALVKTTWLNIKAKLKTYLDTIYEPKKASTDLYVTSAEKSTWSGKQDALTADVDYLTPTTAGTTYEPKKQATDLYVSSGEKSTWNGKQDALTFSTNIETDKLSTSKISAIKTFYDWATGLFATITNLNAKADITPSTGATSALRAMFVARGYINGVYTCVYNTNTGFYEMNGITDLTEAQMLDIYNITSSNINISHWAYTFANSTIRTNFQPLIIANAVGGYGQAFFAFLNSKIEVFKYGGDGYSFIYPQYLFQGCIYLHTVDLLNLTNTTNTVFLNGLFNGCIALVTANVRLLRVNLSFGSSPLLSLASLQYLVTNRANGTTRITITVHATVWAKLNDNVGYPTWNALYVEAWTNQYIDFGV